MMRKNAAVPSKDERHLWTMVAGLTAAEKRLARQRDLYRLLSRFADTTHASDRIVHITSPELFQAALVTFGPCLSPSVPRSTLRRLYDVAFDLDSGALIIANRGATLWCLSPRSETPYISRHIGAAVYLPGLGVETINVGLAGNVYESTIACRAESACAPSFLFGSQRCNCCHQWDSFRELTARFNSAAPPPPLSGDEFEAWVQRQCEYSEGRHLFKYSGPGFISIHLDSQNGMGSGATAGEFCADLFNRASLRHRGEYSAEQMLQTSMAGGFRALGLTPDPRGQQNALGYQVPRIVLDYLGVSRDILLLSNNGEKIRALQEAGYRVRRVKSLGAVNTAGAPEAAQRGSEFGHMDINAECVEFSEELERVTRELGAALLKNTPQ